MTPIAILRVARLVLQPDQPRTPRWRIVDHSCTSLVSSVVQTLALPIGTGVVLPAPRQSVAASARSPGIATSTWRRFPTPAYRSCWQFFARIGFQFGVNVGQVVTDLMRARDTVQSARAQPAFLTTVPDALRPPFDGGHHVDRRPSVFRLRRDRPKPARTPAGNSSAAFQLASEHLSFQDGPAARGSASKRFQPLFSAFHPLDPAKATGNRIGMLACTGSILFQHGRRRVISVALIDVRHARPSRDAAGIRNRATVRFARSRLPRAFDLCLAMISFSAFGLGKHGARGGLGHRRGTCTFSLSLVSALRAGRPISFLLELERNKQVAGPHARFDAMLSLAISTLSRCPPVGQFLLQNERHTDETVRSCVTPACEYVSSPIAVVTCHVH